MVQTEIMKARKVSRNTLLDKKKNKQKQDLKKAINVAYFPVNSDLINDLKELHVILACKKKHQKVLPNVLIIDFK